MIDMDFCYPTFILLFCVIVIWKVDLLQKLRANFLFLLIYLEKKNLVFFGRSLARRFWGIGILATYVYYLWIAISNRPYLLKTGSDKTSYWLGRYSFFLGLLYQKNVKDCVLYWTFELLITNLLVFWHNKTQKEKVFTKSINYLIWTRLYNQEELQ